MKEKIYYFSVLCGILCIHQILADNASDNLVRRKRVINCEQGGDVPLKNGDAPFVVNIRRYMNRVNVCVGAILSKHTVITVANCVAPFNVSEIKVLSGSTFYHRGVEHNIITKNIHIGNHPRRNNDGIALLTVEPAFVFDTRTSMIKLHQEILLPGMYGTIFGWGYSTTVPRGTKFDTKLRSITVPIMNHRDCVNSYRDHFVISDNDICTYDVNKRCGHTDAGAPLVVDNQLAGLYLWRVEIPDRISPDVFVVLQSLEYASWIRNNIIYNVVHVPRGL